MSYNPGYKPVNDLMTCAAPQIKEGLSELQSFVKKVTGKDKFSPGDNITCVEVSPGHKAVFDKLNSSFAKPFLDHHPVLPEKAIISGRFLFVVGDDDTLSKTRMVFETIRICDAENTPPLLHQLTPVIADDLLQVPDEIMMALVVTPGFMSTPAKTALMEADLTDGSECIMTSLQLYALFYDSERLENPKTDMGLEHVLAFVQAIVLVPELNPHS